VTDVYLKSIISSRLVMIAESGTVQGFIKFLIVPIVKIISAILLRNFLKII